MDFEYFEDCCVNDVYHIISKDEGILDILYDLDLNFDYDNRVKIEDVNDFVLKLKIANLYTPELEEFIRNYLKFENK